MSKGARGDGTTVDSQAVRDASTAAGPGGTIIFDPDRTYVIDDISNVASGQRWYGPGARLLLKSGATNPMFRLGDSAALTDVWFEGLEFDGNNFANTTSGILARIKQTTGITFDRCRFHHSWHHALSFASGGAGSSKVLIDHCKFENIGAGYALDNTFSANSPHGCAIAFGTSFVASEVTIDTPYFADVKGAGCVRWDGITKLKILHPTFRRTGYRGVVCVTGKADKGILIVEPDGYEIGGVYESSTPTNDPLYGQGTNGIYAKPLNAEELVIIGGRWERCGENALEVRAHVLGGVIKDTGYAFPNFGADIAKNGIWLDPGSVVDGTRIYNPGTTGIERTGSDLADLIVTNVKVFDPPQKGVHFQQITSGTMARVLVKGVDVISKVGSPTHPVHVRATGGANLGSDVRVSDCSALGTFSGAASTYVEAAGGGTDSAVDTHNSWDPSHVGA
jgi:hypothetical protein